MKTFLKKFLIVILLTFSLVFTSSDSYSITDTLNANSDNTLYQDDFGTVSNGKGNHFFAGKTYSDRIRRGLISFSVTEQIPPGAVVTDVRLVLHMSKTISGSHRVTLYKASKHWGEGESYANGEEGTGTQAETGDATWINNIYSTENWDNPGGDYSGTESANSNVDGIGFYNWSGTQMTNDVQNWVNNNISNYGWILVGDEEDIGTAKRFDTKENSDANVRPKLIVTYTFNKVALRMSALTEGLIQSPIFSAGIPLSVPDTFRVYLRNSFAPYSIVDSAKAFSGSVSWYVFNNASSGSYYIMADQRNSINTWSKFPQSFTTGSLISYDFTSASTQAFGNNLVLKEGSYCFYSGDVNKDNAINLTDVLQVYNSSVAFQSGYVVNDVNGDSIVDLADILITYNNSTNFVQERRP